ncbi:MAG: GldG family protein [Clostridia bacterium]|nr:GldG family protein [Clostridia bacterium]
MKKVKETGLVLTDDTGEMAYHVEVRKSFWNKIRHGAYAVIFTLLFIAVMIGLNVFAGMAAARFDLTWDLTEEKVFTVSDTTLDYLGRLEENVELIMLNGDSEYWHSLSVSDDSGRTEDRAAFSLNRYIVETLDRYDEVSDRVTVHYVNQLYNPGFFKERNNLPVTDDLGDDPVVIVYAPDTGRYFYVRRSLFSDLDVLTFESSLNSGIRYTTNPNMQKIALISGHGEDELMGFQMVMTRDGYQVDTLVLPDVSQIPSEYQMILICNPTRMYSDSDIEKIDRFLSNDELQGKSMMVFADLDFCDLEGDRLKPYLEEWGIKLEDTCIYDPDNTLSLSQSGLGTSRPMYKVNYSEEAAPMTGTLSSGNFHLRFELGKTRPLTKLFEEQQNIAVYSLLTTFDTSFARDQVPSGTDLSFVKKTPDDAAGPFDVGLLALRHRYDNLSEYASSVAVFGSDSLVDDYFVTNMASDNQATQEYLTQLVFFMTAESDDTYEHIPTVSLLSAPLKIDSNSQIVTVWAITAGAIPFLFAAIGFIIWRIRKHL